MADETHRANLAELKSSQALSQSFSTVLSAQQVREPTWVDGEKTIKSALLGGLEQGFEQMLSSPDRNPNLGEMALAIAKLRAEIGQTSEARDAYDQAIEHLHVACSLSQRHANAYLDSLKWKLE